VKRLFVGFELCNVARSQISEIQGLVRSASPSQGVRFVTPAKFHLTLLFLGDLPAESVDQLDDAGRGVCAMQACGELSLAGLGGFPHLQRPRVLWVGVDGDLEGLASLQSSLRDSIGSKPSESEDEFLPHVTIARISPGSKAVGRAAAAVAAGMEPQPIARIEPIEVILFESLSSGPYVALHRWPLAPKLG
jgi:RNA 2',3'-cyclic 3'-phosphodiesterase